MPGGAPGRCASARTTGCGERRAGDAKSKYSDALTGEMAARTLPPLCLPIPNRANAARFSFLCPRPSVRAPEKAVARLLSCGGRRQPYAPTDRAGTRARIRRMSTGKLTSGASAGGQEKSCRETGVSLTSCVLYRRTREGQNRGARLRFMQPLRDFCLMRAAARRRARQNGVQFEHLQYARRSSTGERPLAKGCHDDDTPCTEAATSHRSGTAWRCRCESCRRAQTENIRRCDGRQELPERHGRVFVNSVGRDRFARFVRQSAGKGESDK